MNHHRKVRPILSNPNAKLTSIRLITLSMLLSAVQLITGIAAAQQIVTFTGDPWPPYAEGELGQEATGGMGVELVREIFKSIDGVEASFPLVPWKRALRDVETGAMDGILILLKTQERQRYMAFSDPLFNARSSVWYSRARKPNGYCWQSVDDLRDMRVGVTSGYNYKGEIGEAIDNGALKVTSAPSVENLFAMLAADRLDLVLATDSVGTELAKKYAELDIEATTKSTGNEIYYLGLSRRSAALELLPKINKILQQLKRDGTVDRILGRRKN